MASVLTQSSSGSPETDEYLRLVEKVDWAATSLGPISSWPRELLLLFHLVTLDPQPRLMLLNHDNVMLYNAAYAELVGSRHPAALGSRIKESFPDTYQVTTSVLEEVVATGRASIEKNFCMPVVRNGFLMEVHMSWIVVPFPATSSLTGYSVILRDESDKRIFERRLETSKELSHDCAMATDIQSLWSAAISSLNRREHDCPFALIYAPKSDSSVDDDKVFHLQGTVVGDFGDKPPAPEVVDLGSSSTDPLVETLRQAMTSEELVLLKKEDGGLSEAWSNASRARGWNDPCTQAVILPVRTGKYNKIRGLLIMGLSTRVPYDAANRNWIQEIGRLVGDALTSVRRRDAAIKELAIREREAKKLNLQYQRLIKVIELSDVGIFECDPEGNLLQANDSWYRLAGYPKDSATEPFSWLDYVHPDHTDLVMTNWNKMMKGTSVTYEMRWRCTDRPEGRWILAVCLPVLDEDGRVTSISGCTTDIDAQKTGEANALHALEALERASAMEQRFLRFTENSPIAVHIMELPSHVISYCNSAWFEMLDVPRVPYSELGASWVKGIHEEDVPVVQKGILWLIEAKKPKTLQFRFRRTWLSSDGRRYQCWGSSSCHPELDESGSVKAVMTIITDITHFKWAEEIQRSRVEEALEAKKQQENFIDMTSHEIRNPLGAVVHCADAIDEFLVEMKTIIGELQTSDKEAGDRLRELIASSVEAVNTITSCSAHQKRIVDDLLTLSKLDSNLLQINQTPVRAMSILDDMQRVFEIEAGRAGIDLQIQADPSVQAMGVDAVMLDTGRVHQILINLVTNAIKFTKDRKERTVSITMGASKTRPSDGVLPSDIDFVLPRAVSDTVREPESVSTSPDAFFVWFTVRDTGSGIKPDEKAKLFNRFVQGSPRTYSKYGGSGLGLFISRELAELQSGEIGVATEPGQGSTFAFFVKTQPTISPENRLEPNIALRSRSGSGRTGFDQEAVKIHVLVVEDNAVNQRVLKRQLTNKGYQVWTADNGQDALDFLRTTRHWRKNDTEVDGFTSEEKDLHVVLMDIEMPVMDGLTAAKRIREFQKSGQIRGHIPILSVSANARPEQMSQAIAAGMDDSISKPFRIADLLPKVDRLAELSNIT